MVTTLEGQISKLAARAAVISPAPVRKAVGALARSSTARAAADALVYLFLGTVCVMFAAVFSDVVAFRAYGGNSAVACVTSEVLDHYGTVALLLLAPAAALFFLRAAGRGREVEQSKDDVHDRLLWAAVVFFTAMSLAGLMAFVLQMCGLREVAYLVCVAALLCLFLHVSLFCIRVAVALRRMNPPRPAATKA